jgi:glutamyl-tRNA synthetase
MSVRVRFAPSPTGLLHVGALRTVLFDFLFAKHEGGQCIFRIEDTDRARYNAESEQEFVETLRWVGIEFDEGPHLGGPFGPYRQSERKEAGIYANWIQVLEESGNAYKAFDTSEELDQMREFQQINKQQIGYFGGDWRDASPQDIEKAIADGRTYVIRMRIPRNRKIVVQDAIRGRIEFDSNILPDPVLIKGDGMPTYHFAAMVDDHLMEITHILRGEEWIPTSPIHALLFELFGWEPPVFVHCPVIIGADGKKLSKRHGATRVLDYMAQGYLKSALKNFIALIGWSPGGDVETMTEDELISSFSIEGLQPSPGRFDIEKLNWLNGTRIRSMSTEAVLEEMKALYAESYTKHYWETFVDEDRIPNQPEKNGKLIYSHFENLVLFAESNREYALRCIKEEQERVTNLIDFGGACEFFIVDEPEMDTKAVEKWFGQDHIRELLHHLMENCGRTQLTVDGYREKLVEFQTAKGFDKLGPVVHPTRVALTGKTSGPGLFELMSVLGPERISARVDRALTYVK